jgi:putative ABC transport system substrate-binding protein
MRARLLKVLLLWLPLSTPALPGQERPAPHRLGVFFWHDSPNDVTTFAGIRAGLQRARFVATLLEHHADSDRARASAALAELRRQHCELVFVLGTQAALLAKDELPDVPVVFAAVSDAVASGVVPTWSGSGRNICGASNWIAPSAVLDVFRLAVPGLARLGMIRSQASGVVSAAELATMRAHLAANPTLGLTLHEAVAVDAADIERAVADLVAQDVQALWIPIDLTIYSDLAAVHRGLGSRRLPLLTTAAAGVTNGAHVGAAVDYDLHGRRAAALAVQVLAHGAQPGSLPVDRMRGTQIKINLGAARADGIELPLSILAVADELLDTEASREAR